MVKATSIITSNHSAKIILALSKAALIQKDTHAHLKQNQKLRKHQPRLYPHAKNDIF